MIWTQLCD